VVIVSCGIAERPAMAVLATKPRRSKPTRAAARLTALPYPDSPCRNLAGRGPLCRAAC
jgi:hypothetical protein